MKQDPILKQKEALEAAIRQAEEQVRHDYPGASRIVEELRGLRELVRGTLAEAYRCRIEKALIGMMGFGERARILEDQVRKTIDRPEQYGIQPEQWGVVLVDLTARLLEEECGCQRHPESARR